MKKMPNVLDITERRRLHRKPPRKGPVVPGGGGGGAAQGNLALKTALKVKPRPTPSRWFSAGACGIGPAASPPSRTWS